MKNRKKGAKHTSHQPITREHTIHDQTTESTGSTQHVGSSYGQPKGPRQKMAGAVKKAALPSKVKRSSGANYAGSSGG